MNATPGPEHDTSGPGSAALPVTGHPGIDAALAAVVLGDDVHAHHDVLALAHEVVQHALNPPPQPLPRP